MSEILNNLGIDSTIIIQFIIVFFLYNLAKRVLFLPLQNVLELRKEKTDRAENLAKEYIEKYEELKKEYDFQINKAYKKAQDEKTEKKNEIDSLLTKEFRAKEKEINLALEKEKQVVIQAVQEKRNSILSQSDNLAEMLIQRVTQ